MEVGPCSSYIYLELSGKSLRHQRDILVALYKTLLTKKSVLCGCTKTSHVRRVGEKLCAISLWIAVCHCVTPRDHGMLYQH